MTFNLELSERVLIFCLLFRLYTSTCIQMAYVPSKTTDPITIRMKKEDVQLIDKMVELGGFESRGDCLRAFVKPIFEVAKDAMQKKKIGLSSIRISMQEYGQLAEHLSKMAKASEFQEELFGDLPELEVQPA